MKEEPRPSSGGNLDPSNWRSLRAQGHRMLDDILDYVELIRERPVWQPIPDRVRARFSAPLPTAPADLAAVHQEFMRDILPYSTGIPIRALWVGCMVVEIQPACWRNARGRSHANLRWTRSRADRGRATDCPVGRRVVWVSGERDRSLRHRDVDGELSGCAGRSHCQVGRCSSPQRRCSEPAAARRLCVVCSPCCIAQAMDLSGLGIDALRVVPTNEYHQIDLNALETAIEADRRAAFTPFLIIGTAGTVDIGAVDNLAKLADIAPSGKAVVPRRWRLRSLAILAPKWRRVSQGSSGQIRLPWIFTNGRRFPTMPAS